MSSLKNKILMFVIGTLFIYSVCSSLIAYDYYQEYNRVQNELVDLAISMNIEDNTTEEVQEIPDEDIISLTDEFEYIEYSVPYGHNSFRSWMPSSAISKTSKQGQYVRISTADKDGLLMIDDCYCVALGTYYGNLGDIFRVTTSTGSTFKVVMADVKANVHTDKLNQYTISNGCMMEFIVNKDTLNPSIKTSGSVNTEIISGNIIKMEKEIQKYE